MLDNNIRHTGQEIKTEQEIKTRQEIKTLEYLNNKRDNFEQNVDLVEVGKKLTSTWERIKYGFDELIHREHKSDHVKEFKEKAKQFIKQTNFEYLNVKLQEKTREISEIHIPSKRDISKIHIPSKWLITPEFVSQVRKYYDLRKQILEKASEEGHWLNPDKEKIEKDEYSIENMQKLSSLSDYESLRAMQKNEEIKKYFSLFLKLYSIDIYKEEEIVRFESKLIVIDRLIKDNKTAFLILEQLYSQDVSKAGSYLNFIIWHSKLSFIPPLSEEKNVDITKFAEELSTELIEKWNEQLNIYKKYEVYKEFVKLFNDSPLEKRESQTTRMERLISEFNEGKKEHFLRSFQEQYGTVAANQIRELLKDKTKYYQENPNYPEVERLKARLDAYAKLGLDEPFREFLKHHGALGLGDAFAKFNKEELAELKDGVLKNFPVLRGPLERFEGENPQVGNQKHFMELEGYKESMQFLQLLNNHHHLWKNNENKERMGAFIVGALGEKKDLKQISSPKVLQQILSLDRYFKRYGQNKEFRKVLEDSLVKLKNKEEFYPGDVRLQYQGFFEKIEGQRLACISLGGPALEDNYAEFIKKELSKEKDFGKALKKLANWIDNEVKPELVKLQDLKEKYRLGELEHRFNLLLNEHITGFSPDKLKSTEAKISKLYPLERRRRFIDNLQVDKYGVAFKDRVLREILRKDIEEIIPSYTEKMNVLDSVYEEAKEYRIPPEKFIEAFKSYIDETKKGDILANPPLEQKLRAKLVDVKLKQSLGSGNPILLNAAGTYLGKEVSEGKKSFRDSPFFNLSPREQVVLIRDAYIAKNKENYFNKALLYKLLAEGEGNPSDPAEFNHRLARVAGLRSLASELKGTDSQKQAFFEHLADPYLIDFLSERGESKARGSAISLFKISTRQPYPPDVTARAIRTRLDAVRKNTTTGKQGGNVPRPGETLCAVEKEFKSHKKRFNQSCFQSFIDSVGEKCSKPYTEQDKYFVAALSNIVTMPSEISPRDLVSLEEVIKFGFECRKEGYEESEIEFCVKSNLKKQGEPSYTLDEPIKARILSDLAVSSRQDNLMKRIQRDPVGILLTVLNPVFEELLTGKDNKKKLAKVNKSLEELKPALEKSETITKGLELATRAGPIPGILLKAIPGAAGDTVAKLLDAVDKGIGMDLYYLRVPGAKYIELKESGILSFISPAAELLGDQIKHAHEVRKTLKNQKDEEIEIDSMSNFLIFQFPPIAKHLGKVDKGFKLGRAVFVPILSGLIGSGLVKWGAKKGVEIGLDKGVKKMGEQQRAKREFEKEMGIKPSFEVDLEKLLDSGTQDAIAASIDPLFEIISIALPAILEKHEITPYVPLFKEINEFIQSDNDIDPTQLQVCCLKLLQAIFNDLGVHKPELVEGLNSLTTLND